MFKNKWIKITFYIWVICIPLALLRGFLRASISTVLLTVGIIGAVAGLVISKTLGGKVR